MAEAEPVKIEVLLAYVTKTLYVYVFILIFYFHSYEKLPALPDTSTKKGRMILRSSLKKKKKTKGVKQPGPKPNKGPQKAQKGKNKKKRGKKKKPVSNVEVTTNHEEVLEDPEDLDDIYKGLREKVLKKLEEEGRAQEVSRVDRSKTLESKINSILATDCDTFYLVDLTTVVLKYKYFKKYMPRVTPFYAVKCNPDPFLISTLVACGAGLDVASKPEMQKGLTAKQDPDKMIFANPCKMGEHIRFAAESGVTKMTFDNAEELRKIHKFFPGAQLVLRILADDSHSTMRFGSKFGANVSTEVEPLLKQAYALNLNVIGVSFHVGSGCQSGEAYRNSLLLAKKVFDIAEGHGHPMSFLDIGGGFLGSDTETVIFSDIAKSITASLDELFAPEVRVIAEPGRYFASECVVLVTTVIARRERSHEIPDSGESETCVDYYISDGVYGSFNNMFFDYYRPTPVAMKKEGEKDDGKPVSGSPPKTSELAPPEPTQTITTPGGTEHRSTLFGPTCDSIDVVCKDIELPELEIGDHVYFFNMGAYTAAAASHFNGFAPPKPHYIIS